MIAKSCCSIDLVAESEELESSEASSSGSDEGWDEGRHASIEGVFCYSLEAGGVLLDMQCH